MFRITGSLEGLLHIREIPLSRRALMGRGAALGAGALAATGWPGAARAETALGYVGWEGYDEFLQASDYLAEHDLSLDKTYVAAPEEMITKLRLDPRNVDITVPYFIQLGFIVDSGLLMPLDLEKIPNFQRIFPGILDASQKHMKRDGAWYAAPFTWASIPLMYNAEVVTRPMTSWMDMLAEEFRGKSAIPADSTSVFSTWGRVVTGNSSPNRMTLDELRQTTDFVIDMKRNHLRTIAPTYGDLAAMLASGEIVVCEGFEPVAAWAGPDAPALDWSYPEEGCMSYIEGWAIGAETEHADAVHALIDHSLSVEAQIAGAEYNGMPVTNQDAVAGLSDWNRASYPYDNVSAFFTENIRVEEMYLLEPDGVNATWDDYLAAWEEILKA